MAAVALHLGAQLGKAACPTAREKAIQAWRRGSRPLSPATPENSPWTENLAEQWNYDVDFEGGGIPTHPKAISSSPPITLNV